MKSYGADDIRNVVFASHSGAGTTSLIESCLYYAGVTDRMGRVEDGNTIADYLPEELKRHGSITAKLVAFEYSDTKFNLIDTPGYADFFGEVCAAMTAAENVVLVANATAGLEVGLETAAQRAIEHNLRCFVFVNQLDRERADFDTVLDALQDKLHLPVVALTYPLGQQADFRGYVDIVEHKAYEEKDGEVTPVEIPDEILSRVDELQQRLVEAAVEVDDEMMMKYLEGEELTVEEIRPLLRQCEESGRIVPVMCGSATRGIGEKRLLQALQRIGVPPSHAPRTVAGIEPAAEDALIADPDAPFSGFVWKTFADPFTGRLSFIRVVSGTLRRDADVVNLDHGHHEKLAHLFTPLGKKQTETEMGMAGDIVVVNKLKNTSTGDSLHAEATGVLYARPDLPEAYYSLAIEPVTRGDDDKLGDALAKLQEEDQTLRITRHAETGQTIVSGLGDIHLTTMVSRLKSSYGVAVVTHEPRVAYRETIRQAVEAEGKLKKQSGGHGQFADVRLTIEPNEPGGGFEFVDKIVGGVVPRSFIPAVEEGVRDAMREGPLAGYPLVDVKVTLHDGRYHDVDSSYQTFKIAGAMGLRHGTRDAGPVLLEPLMDVCIEVPEAAAGDVIGDLNSRRGQILGMETPGDGTVQVRAYVPDAELQSYALTLRSLAHGRGRFAKCFDHYSAVPEHVTRSIVEVAQRS